MIPEHFRKYEMMLYYFFLMADGEVSAKELQRFLSICDAMEIPEEDAEEVISYCQKAIRTTNQDNSDDAIDSGRWIHRRRRRRSTYNASKARREGGLCRLSANSYLQLQFKIPLPGLVHCGGWWSIANFIQGLFIIF